jgi:hypothetical protein
MSSERASGGRWRDKTIFREPEVKHFGHTKAIFAPIYKIPDVILLAGHNIENPIRNVKNLSELLLH